MEKHLEALNDAVPGPLWHDPGIMPALLARGLTSDFWRFVLGGLAVTQLVFLSEFGVLVLRSSLPVGLADLSLVFGIRTLVTAPMLCAGAWVFS